MSIHPVQQSDLPRIARFVAGLNADPTHNICFFGDSEAEVLAWLGDAVPDSLRWDVARLPTRHRIQVALQAFQGAAVAGRC